MGCVIDWPGFFFGKGGQWGKKRRGGGLEVGLKCQRLFVKGMAFLILFFLFFSWFN